MILRLFFQKSQLWKYCTFLISFSKTSRPIRPPKFIFNAFSNFYVASYVAEIAQFLSYLVVVLSCKLHLHTWDDTTSCDTDTYRTILSWVSNQFRAPTTSLPTSDASGHEEYIRSLHFSVRSRGCQSRGILRCSVS